MRSVVSRLAALSTVALLAACATSQPGAQVTRFHLGQPIARSTVMLVPADPQQGGSLEFQSYAGAVARELTAQSFVPVTNDLNSAYVGTISVTQDVRPGQRRGGFSIGLGGGSFGRGGGVGGGVSLPVGQTRPSDIRTTTLGLQLKRRSDSTVIWEGKATSEATGPGGDLTNAVPPLAHALLDGFPGARGQTVRVKTR